jgi:outer membrane protein
LNIYKQFIILCSMCGLFLASNVYNVSLAAVEQDSKTLKVGVIKAKNLENSLYFQDIHKKLEKEFSGRGDKLSSKRQELKSKIELFDRNKAIWSEKERVSKENELNKLDQEIQQTFEKLETDFKNRHQEELSSFNKSLDNVLKDFAKKENYNLILLDQVALYNDDNLDCTEQVVNILNNQFKNKK